MITDCVMIGRAESGLMVCTPEPGILNAIVPPPMLLASRIACRSEPVPLSLVFVTVKTKGATGLSASVDSCAAVAIGSLALRTRMVEMEWSPWRLLNALAKVDASKIEKIDNKATTSVTRNAKAAVELFFFILLLG